MATQHRQPWVALLRDNLALRVAAYYVLLAALATLAWRLLPARVWNLSAGPPALAALLAILSATLLALPVAWLYILTRQKKGYRQSVVQTLVLLPLVVAGVVVLVKNSLALAFSLAGIVAAVRFRNTLEDSKDAVYIFLATGIGLAAGVEVGVAVVLSVLFNAIILFLWYTDFGRSPANLEGHEAAQRLERARAIANRTGAFVARIDNEILEAMAPEQLDALADRAWRRRKRNEPGWEDGERPGFEALLRVHTEQVDPARKAVEPILDESLKRWQFGGVVHEEDGTHVVEYRVQLRKSMMPRTLLDALHTRCASHVISAEVH